MIDRAKIDRLRAVIGKLRTRLDAWQARTVADKMSVIIIIALIALGLLFVAVMALLMS